MRQLKRAPRRRSPLLSLLAAVSIAGALGVAAGPVRAAARPAPTPPSPCAYLQADPAPTCPPPPCYTTPSGSGFAAFPCPAPRGSLALTEKDGGRTVTVHAGTRIAVHLSGGGVWSAPASSDGRVVTRTAAGRSSNGDAHGRFRAAGNGRADLTASDAPRCAPMCKVLTRLWIVHIVVVP